MKVRIPYKIIEWVAPTLGSVIFYVLDFTIFWKVTYLSSETDIREALKKPVIFAFWHNQQLLMLFTYRRFFRKMQEHDRGLVTLSSQHRDGRLIAKILGRFGIQNLAGSSSNGQLSAVRGMIRGLQQGHHLSITPDGPRGPQFEAKRGLIEVARRTDSVIIPIAMAANRPWIFNSWDKMFLAKPFSTVHAVFGKPFVANDYAQEESHIRATEQLNLVWETAKNLHR